MSQTNTENWEQIRQQSENALTPDIVEFIRTCRDREHPESHLIAVLHRVQREFGYLAPEQLDAVAQLLQIPAAKVSGVASFYHFFRLQPPGRHTISLCLGTACYVRGAERVAERLKGELGIDFGETTTDGVFSLEGTRCLGSCGLAPVLTVGEDVYGHVTPDQIPGILEPYFTADKDAHAA